jgi:mono/diheme cytochrome c family protein
LAGYASCLGSVGGEGLKGDWILHKSILRWVAVILGVFLGLAFLSLAAVYYITEERINRVYAFPENDLVIPSDPETVKRGEHLVITMGLCSECHGVDLAGEVWDDGPLVGRMGVANLTSGEGGIGADYTDSEWVNAIRHGIGRDGKSLMFMQSNFYNPLSGDDLVAMIAYLKTIPPVDKIIPQTQLGPMARWILLQDPTLLPAAVIDHTQPPPAKPEVGVTVEYGQYLANVCTACHGYDLAGSIEPGSGLNLTPGGELKNWTEADFISTLRTGIKPDGSKIDPLMMPYPSIGQMTDEELQAIWLYLQTLPAVEDTPLQRRNSSQ